MSKKPKNYTQYFANRPELAKLVAKYSGESTDPVMVGDETENEPEGILDVESFDEPDEHTPQGIRIVNVSEFANNEDYDSITLSYYSDDVVTDEHNIPISHPEQLIGDDALVSFGEESDDEDVVYICNDFKKCMYEVVRTDRPFAAVPSGNKKRTVKEDVDNDAEEVDPD